MHFDPSDFNPQLRLGNPDADVWIRLDSERFGDAYFTPSTLVSLQYYSDRKEEIDQGATIPADGSSLFLINPTRNPPPGAFSQRFFSINENSF